jgi:multimeric flavodoxin WrbA
MSKVITIVGRKNGKSLGLLRRVLESAADQTKVEVGMETRAKRAMDELAKSCRYSQKVLRGINESLTLGNSKGNQKN